MVQTAIIVVAFALALLYVGRLVYRMLLVKKSCGGNCKCGVDFSHASPPAAVGKHP